jgi:hypothetical protein
MNREKLLSLHSRYNPQAEAERYISSQTISEKTRFFILMEPGLGYMIGPIKKRAPGAKIISLHAAELEDTQAGAAPAERPDSEWDPGTGISIQDFLEREIPDSEASEIRLLEWRPALAMFGAAYLKLIEETLEFIKRSDANARTQEFFQEFKFTVAGS